MELSEEMVHKITEELIGALPEEAETDYQAWLDNPSEEGLAEMLRKYNIDAEKIARAKILEEQENE